MNLDLTSSSSRTKKSTTQKKSYKPKKSNTKNTRKSNTENLLLNIMATTSRKWHGFLSLSLIHSRSLSIHQLHPKTPNPSLSPQYKIPHFFFISFNTSNKSYRIHHLHKHRPQNLSTKSPKIQNPKHKVIKTKLKQLYLQKPISIKFRPIYALHSNTIVGAVFTGVLTVLLSLCFNILFLLLLILLFVSPLTLKFLTILF